MKTEFIIQSILLSDSQWLIFNNSLFFIFLGVIMVNMKLIKGKKIAEEILSDIKKNIEKEKSTPGLAVILVGKDEASHIYVSLKEKSARETGIKFRRIEFPEDISEDLVLKEIEGLNSDKSIHGIIVQLPLPGNMDKNKIIGSIKPEKDADGFHPENLNNYFAGIAEIMPVFPSAILELIKSSEQELSQKKAVIICNSKDFGKTMQNMLKKEEIESEYIFCPDMDKNRDKIRSADILITACGKAGLIKGEMMKDGAIVIDGGIIKIGKKVAGDVDFESVKDRNIFLTPVPGGIGPVTIACLLRNVYFAYKKSSC